MVVRSWLPRLSNSGPGEKAECSGRLSAFRFFLFYGLILSQGLKTGVFFVNKL
jgi:hypothetical protein